MVARMLIRTLPVLLLALVSCTKKNHEKSTVVVSLPFTITKAGSNKAGSLASTDEYAHHIVVNVSGPGIPGTKVESWDRGYRCTLGSTDSSCVPRAFSFDLAKGNNPLIQVLGVFSSEEGETFYYGETQELLTSTEQKVTVNLVAFVSSGTLEGGQIAGRYYDSNGNTPTGRISMKYGPPGRTPMIVEQREISAGWFSVFALKNVPFKYELENGTDLFGGPVTLAADVFSSARTLRIEIPSYYRTYDQRQESGESLVLGYFGTPPAGKSVCRPSTSYTMTSFKESATGPYLTYPESFTFSGGSTTCAGSEFTDYLMFSPRMFDHMGHESSLGFRGMFRKVSGDWLVSSNGSILDWEYLPDIDGSIIDGVRIFARANTSTSSSGPRDFEQNGEVICDNLVGLGFTEVTTVPVATTEVATSVITNALNSTGSITVLLCPFKGEKSYTTVMETNICGSNCGGPGSSPSPSPSPGSSPSPSPSPTPSPSPSSGPPTSVVVEKAAQPYNGVMSYTCYQYRVALRNASQMPSSHSSPLTFTVQSNGADTSYYTSYGDCNGYTNAQGPQLTLPSNQNDIYIYLKIPSGGATTAVMSVVYSGSSPALTTTPSSLPIKSYSDTTFRIDSPSNMLAGMCYPVQLNHIKYDNMSYPLADNTTVNLNAQNGAQAYSDASCSTQITSLNLSGGAYGGSFYLKLSGSASGASLTTHVTAGPTVDDATAYFSLGSGSSSITAVQVSGNGGFSRDSCVGPVDATFYNSSGVPIVLGSSVTMTLSTSSLAMTYYSDSNCSTAVSSPVTVTPGKYRYQFYMKSATAGSGTLSASLASVPPGNMSLTVSGLHHLVLTAAENAPFNHGTCVQLNIEAKNLDNSSATFNTDTTLTFGGVPTDHLFYGRLGGTCMLPVSAPIVMPAYTSPKILYMLVENATSASENRSVSVSASNVLSGTLSFAVNAPPTLTAILADSTQYIAAEYIYRLEKAFQKFTGVPSYSYSKISGTGTLSGMDYTSSAGNTAVLTVTDSRTPTATSMTINTSTVVKSATLDFVSGSMPSNVSFTRSTAATYYNASGILTDASAEAPRFAYNPDSNGNFIAHGLLMEGSSTNLFTHSENFTSGAWQTSTLPAPTSTTITTSPRGTLGGVYLLSDTNYEPYNVGFLSNQFTSDMVNDADYVASVFIKKNTSQYAGLQIQENGVMSSSVLIDLNTGNVAPMTGPYTPQQNYGYGVQKLPNNWYRIWVRYHTSPTCTNGGSGPCQGWIAIFPAHSTSGSTYGEVSATGSVFIFGAQVEIGSAMTSYVASSGTNGYRAADMAYATMSAALSGYISSMGSMRFEFFNPHEAAEKGAGIAKVYYGSGEEINVETPLTSMLPQMSVRAGSTAQGTLTSTMPLIKNAINVMSFSWETTGTSRLNFGANGEPMAISGTPGVPALSNGTLQLGASTPHFYRKVEYWPYKISAPGLGSM